jgi:hypothetical protein
MRVCSGCVPCGGLMVAAGRGLFFWVTSRATSPVDMIFSGRTNMADTRPTSLPVSPFVRPSHNVNFGAPFGQEDGFYSQGDFASSATVLGTSDSLHVFKGRILATGPATQPRAALRDRAGIPGDAGSGFGPTEGRTPPPGTLRQVTRLGRPIRVLYSI